MRKRPAEMDAVQEVQDTLIESLQTATAQLQAIVDNGASEMPDPYEVETYTDAACTATEIKVYGALGEQYEPFTLPAGYTRETYSTKLTEMVGTFPSWLTLTLGGTQFNVEKLTTQESMVLPTSLTVSAGGGLRFTANLTEVQIRPFLSSEYAAVAALDSDRKSDVDTYALWLGMALDELDTRWVPTALSPEIYQQLFTNLDELYEGIPHSMSNHETYRKRRQLGTAPSSKTFTFEVQAKCTYTVSFQMYVRRMEACRSMQMALLFPSTSTRPSSQVPGTDTIYYGICLSDMSYPMDAVTIVIPPITFYATVSTITIQLVGYYEFISFETATSPLVCGGALTVLRI